LTVASWEYSERWIFGVFGVFAGAGNSGNFPEYFVPPGGTD